MVYLFLKMKACRSGESRLGFLRDVNQCDLVKIETGYLFCSGGFGYVEVHLLITIYHLCITLRIVLKLSISYKL